MNGKITKRLKSQRGIAMMVALLALLLLAAIGMGLMFMADTENSVNNNYRDSQKAYFAARAGAEDARLLLVKDATLNTNAMALNTGSPFQMIYLKNPTNGEAIDPTTAAGSTLATNPYLDDQLCWERFAQSDFDSRRRTLRLEWPDGAVADRFNRFYRYNHDADRRRERIRRSAI